MAIKRLKKWFPVFFIVISTYLLFFWKLLLPTNLLYSGKDSFSFHYPSRIYLNEKLTQSEFPFWTERLFMGFPIFADMERGYLNPINVFLIYFFGPFTSFKILHFICYLVGSVSLFIFLKKYGSNYWAFAAANSVYFFSFFPLYHQQHFNMVITYYLFPLGLLLIDKLIGSHKLRYSIFNSLLLAFCFYLGSFQFVFLIILIELLYLYYSLGFSKKFFFYIIHTFLLFLIFSIPGLFSTFELYLRSFREGNLLHSIGSFTPVMIINLIFPFIFNFSEKYMGVLQSSEYVIQETYIYVGISTLLFSIFGYLTLKNSSLKNWINSLIFLFFFLAFLKSIPIVNEINLIPFSLFRYWVRSVSLLNMAFSILVYIFIVDFDMSVGFKKFFSSKIIYYPVLFLLTLEIFNFKKYDFVNLAKILMRHDYEFGYWFLVYFSILTLSLIFIAIKKFHKRYLFSLLIIFDLLLFGFIATKDSMFENKDLLRNTSIDAYFHNIRIIDYSSNGDRALLNSTWGISGYSVFFFKDIPAIIADLGLESIRYPIPTQLNTEIFEKLSKLGVSYIIQPNKEMFRISKNTTLLNLNDNLIISNYVQKEGYVSFEINSPSELLLNTYITNYPGWLVYIDGKQSEIVSNNRFISIHVPVGVHEIQILFTPISLYNGIKTCILGLLLFIFGSIYVSKKIK